MQNSPGLKGCEDTAWFILGTYFEQSLKPELQRYHDSFMESDSGIVQSVNFITKYVQGQFQLKTNANPA